MMRLLASGPQYAELQSALMSVLFAQRQLIMILGARRGCAHVPRLPPELYGYLYDEFAAAVWVHHDRQQSDTV